MRKFIVRLTASALPLAVVALCTGCDRADVGSGDSHHVEPSGAVGGGRPSSAQISAEGNGNAATTAGTGATNFIVGNETLNWATGAGNTPAGRGTTTRPSGSAPGTSVVPPDSGSTGGSSGGSNPAETGASGERGG